MQIFNFFTYFSQELEKDMPKTVFDDLRRKLDRLGEPMKTGLNKIKKEQLRKVGLNVFFELP